MQPQELRDTLTMVVQGCALPQQADLSFAAINSNDLPLRTLDRQAEAISLLPRLLGTVGDEEVFIVLANQGNMLEMMAELERHQYDQRKGLAGLTTLLQAVTAMQTSDAFHQLRARILRPLQGATSDQQQGAIQQAKEALLQVPGVPAGVTPDDISWDAVSFKIAPTASEYFVQKNPDILEKLDQTALSIIDDVEDICYNTIKEKCAEFRTRSETYEDEFISDVTLFLETQIAGKVGYDRTDRVKMYGMLTLAKYVDRMQGLFASGNLPGAIPPGKIFGCHDVVSQVQLRAAIQELSETQIFQQAQLYDTGKTPSLLSGIRSLAPSGGDDLSKPQQQSIRLKQNVDLGMRVGLESVGDRFNDPRRDLANQLSGGSNTFRDAIDFSATGQVLNLSEGQRETLKQQVSLLLACLRIRSAASQQSSSELVSDEDFDHYEIVKELSQLANLTADDKIYREAVVAQQTYMFGHNDIKFQGKTLPQELLDVVNYSMHGRLSILLKSIPLFDADIQEGGMIFQSLLQATIKSLTLRNRINNEVIERAARRQALFKTI